MGLSFPARRWSSVPQMPQTATFTSTLSGSYSGTGICSIRASSVPCVTTAFMVWAMAGMDPSFLMAMAIFLGRAPSPGTPTKD